MKISKKKLLYILIPIVTLLILGISFGFYGYRVAKSFLPDAEMIKQTANELQQSFQDQDLIQTKQKSQQLKDQLMSVNLKYQKYSWLNKFPFLNNYYKDGQSVFNAADHLAESLNTLVISIEPYADLLGFVTSASASADAKQKTNQPQTIEDRIIFMAQTLDKISPELDKVASGMEMAQQELDKINVNRYPESIQGKPIRSKIVNLRSAIDESAILLSQAKPLIKLFPELLGNPNSKTYMVLLQNDAELRATGGFMTAYAFLRVTKGKIEPLASYDIYDLDARFRKRVEAPEPIKKYLNENYLNLRNINISPDFKVSMDEFYKYYRDLGLPKIDGIIAIDTQFPVEILKIIGPIGVGGWGNFGPEMDKRCDCPQVVYALEEIADKPVSGTRTGRKAVIGPLMHSMMANAMGSPKHTWPKLLNVGLSAIKEKHLIFYFLEDQTQKVADDFNATGRIKEYSGDYLHINDSNFGGAKTDMFITREVEQEITNENGVVSKTVSISYNNPRKGDNCNLEAGQLCLNGTYRDYVRLYVPKGSKLISVVGSEVKESVLEDLNKTVFEAFFTMRPQSQSKIVFKYELPSMDLSVYKMLIQKQPGTKTIKHTITYNGSQINFDLVEDKEITLN